MIGRIFFAVVIILGCGYMGRLKGEKYRFAVKQTGEFAEALKMLEFDVSFLKLPAKDAFLRINFSKESTVKKIFSYMAGCIGNGDSISLQETFSKALEKYEDSVFVCDFAKDTMYNFFKSFGGLDRENEISNIRAAYTKLKFLENDESASAESNAKMSCRLGIIAGVFFAIILF